MNLNIQQLLESGEGISIEYKKAGTKLPENFFESVCAFLNRNGGHILLGVGDDRSVTGVSKKLAEALCKNITNLSNNPQKINPTFLIDPKIIEYSDKILIHVYVPASSQVHRCNGKVFDRSHEGDYELKSDVQIKSLCTRKNSFYSENTIYPFLTEAEFIPGIVERARQAIKNNRPDHPWNELSNETFFRNAGLFRKDYLSGREGFTMAALLLFGKDEVIQSVIPHYKVDAVLRTADLNRYDDRENIRCNLINAYDRIMNFISKHLPDKFYLEGDLRISLREKNFREIIANLLIHREYTNAFPSVLLIYKDRVETKNANKPHVFGLLHPETLQHSPKIPTLPKYLLKWDGQKNWEPVSGMFTGIQKHIPVAKTLCLQKRIFSYQKYRWVPC